MAVRFVKKTLISFLLALYEPFSRSGTSKLAGRILVHWGLDALPYLLNRSSHDTSLIIDSICHRLSRKPTARCVPALIDLVRSTTTVSARSDLLYALRDIGGPQAMAFLVDMRKDPTQRPDVALHIRQVAEKEVEIAKRCPEGADRTYVPALIGLAKAMPQEPASRDRSSRSEILTALGLIGGPEAVAALIDMLEDPKQWMKEDIARHLDKCATSEILSAGLSERLAQVVEREIVKEPPAWIKMTFPVLTRCKTREADHVLRLVLRKGPSDAVLEALSHIKSLDPSWLDDVLYSYDVHRSGISEVMCRTLARIPDGRSLHILLKFFAPPKSAREVAEAINYMAGTVAFPVEGAALAELESVLRESWELGSYRLEAQAVGRMYDTLVSTNRSVEPDTSYHARMLKLWTTGTLEKLLPDLSPSDELLDATAIPKEISYVEGTLQEIVRRLEGYDKANYEKFPGLHKLTPYFCRRHYAVIRGGYEFSSDFYGTITAVLFRWKRGTYGCCSYDHSSWLMIPRESETLGVVRFLQELVSAKAER